MAPALSFLRSFKLFFFKNSPKIFCEFSALTDSNAGHIIGILLYQYSFHCQGRKFIYQIIFFCKLLNLFVHSHTNRVDAEI